MQADTGRSNKHVGKGVDVDCEGSRLILWQHRYMENLCGWPGQLWWRAAAPGPAT